MRDAAVIAIRLVFVCFLAYHAATVVVMTLPDESALFRTAYQPFRWYVTLTGVSQNWNMFDSIPSDHTLEVLATARTSSGRLETFGPVLPGLRQVDSSYFRYHSFFSRIDTGRYTIYRDAYLDRLLAVVQETRDPHTTEITVSVVHHRMRYLHEIRRDGQIARRDERRLRPGSAP